MLAGTDVSTAWVANEPLPVNAETVARVCNLRDPASQRVKGLLDSLRQIGNIDRENLARLYALGHDVGNVTRPGIDGNEPEDFPAAFDTRGYSVS